MKEIKAYVRPSKITAVTLALHRIEALTGMSLWQMRGFGRCRSPKDTPAILQELVDFVPYARLEILCPDDLEVEVVTTIQNAAFTGEPADGKIFVTSLDRVVRIADEAHGEAAVKKQFCPKCQAREDAAMAADQHSSVTHTAHHSTPLIPANQEEL